MHRLFLLALLVSTGCTTVAINYCDSTATGDLVNCRPANVERERAVPRQQL